MSIFDAPLTTLYKYTKDGRRIYTFGLYRNRQFLIPDQATQLLERRVRRYHQLLLLLIALAALLSSALHLEWPWPILVAGFLTLAGSGSLTRGLPRVHVRAGDFRPVDRRAQALARARATGRPTLIGLILAAVAMTGVGVYTVAVERAWIGWVLFAITTTGAGYFGRQLWLLGRPPGPSDNPPAT